MAVADAASAVRIRIDFPRQKMSRLAGDLVRLLKWGVVASLSVSVTGVSSCVANGAYEVAHWGLAQSSLPTWTSSMLASGIFVSAPSILSVELQKKGKQQKETNKTPKKKKKTESITYINSVW